MQQINYCLYVKPLVQNYQFRFILPSDLSLSHSLPTTPKAKILNSYSYRLCAKECTEKNVLYKSTGIKIWSKEKVNWVCSFYSISSKHRDFVCVCVFLWMIHKLFVFVCGHIGMGSTILIIIMMIEKYTHTRTTTTTTKSHDSNIQNYKTFCTNIYCLFFLNCWFCFCYCCCYCLCCLFCSD